MRWCFSALNCGEKCGRCGSCAGPVRAVSGLLVGLSDLLDGNNKAASVRTEAEDGQAAGGVSSGPHRVADMGINESTALV